MNIKGLYGTSDFESKDLADKLNFDLKKVSNDLSRIHGMRFLKRKKIKRTCFSENGEPCFKGKAYLYSINKQGLSYLEWYQKNRLTEILAYHKLREEAFSDLPENLRNDLLSIENNNGRHQFKGPTSKFRLMIDSMAPLNHLLARNRELKGKLSSQTSMRYIFETLNDHQKELLNTKEEKIREHDENFKKIYEIAIQMGAEGITSLVKMLLIQQKKIQMLSHIRELLFFIIAKNFPSHEVEDLQQLISEYEKLYYNQ